MKSTVLAVSAVVSLAFVASGMPSRNELKKVQPTVNELMAEDIAAMKGGKQSSEGAAKKAEELAGLATDEASKFLLLKGAFGLYVEGGKYDEAVAALEKLTREVKDVPDKVLADIVRGKMKKISKKNGGAIFAFYAQLDRRIRYGAEKAKYEKAVKDNPADKGARRSLALALSVLGDWKGALGEYAQAGGDEQKAAKAEEAGQAVAAADLWWTVAQASADEDAQEVLRAHAADLYAQAVRDGKLDGIKKALAEKRIAEVSPVGAPAAEGETPSAQTPPPAPKSARESKPAAATNVPVPKKKYDWTIPRKISGAKKLDFELGGGQKMRFLAVAPGECEALNAKYCGFPPFTVKITRPFWISQIPVTCRQYELFRSLDGHPMRIKELEEKLRSDKDVAVCAPVSYEDIQAYLAWMNERYGHLLPRGQVFRAPTFGETSLLYGQLKMRSYASSNFVPFLRSKGLCGDDVATIEDLHRFLGRSPYHLLSICNGLKRLESDNRVFRSGASFILDHVSVPTMAGEGYFHSNHKADLLKAFNLQKTEVDPFRYCPEDAPARRYCIGAMWLEVGNGDPRGMCLSVVVGFDYVGDWKKRNGK